MRQVLLELRQRIGDLLDVVLQVGDLLGAGLGKEARFLQGVLGVLRAAALLAQRDILRIGLALRLIDLRIESGDLLAQYRHLFVYAVLLALLGSRAGRPLPASRARSARRAPRCARAPG